MIVGITYTSDEYLPKAKELAYIRGFEFASAKNNNIRFWLVVSPDGIKLEDTSSNIGNLQIDFLLGSNLHRLRHSTGQREYLLRAIGKYKPGAIIVDATAGLASDGFMLAARGFQVKLIEQNLIVASLLEDALDRACKDTEYGKMLATNLKLQIGRAQDILDNLSPKPQVIYLDPMYPKKDKSSLPTKNMQYLREIIVPEESNNGLLANALQNVRGRVVVKRPESASYLEDISPSHQIFGKTTRYDVYVV